MANLSIDAFVSAVHRWAQKRKDDFAACTLVNGGWDEWIQIDLIAFLKSHDYDSDALRIKWPAGDGEQTSILLNSSLEQQYQILVQVRAESLENMSNPGENMRREKGSENFLRAIHEDVKMLTHERSDDFSRCCCIMMALPFTKHSYNAIVSFEQNDQKIFRVIFHDEIAVAIAINTPEDGWVQA